MHALAQPLAIVQGTLEIASIGATTVDEYQKAVEESLAQIERAAELLSYVKELVKVNREPQSSPPVAAISVFEEVFEDLRCVFDDAKVRLVIHCDGAVAESRAEQSHMRQALFYVLQAARSHGGAGSTVDLSANIDGDFLRISIKALSAQGNATALQTLSTSTEARSMALAETIVIRDGGRFSFQAEPFESCLWFPIVAQEAEMIERTGT